MTFHAEYCTSHGCTVHTYQTVRIQIPPQEVIDRLKDVFQIIADETAFLDRRICEALKFARVPEFINALTFVTGFSMDSPHGNDDCDLWDEFATPSRERLIDFWPYDD